MFVFIHLQSFSNNYLFLKLKWNEQSRNIHIYIPLLHINPCPKNKLFLIKSRHCKRYLNSNKMDGNSWCIDAPVPWNWSFHTCNQSHKEASHYFMDSNDALWNCVCSYYNLYEFQTFGKYLYAFYLNVHKWVSTIIFLA